MGQLINLQEFKESKNYEKEYLKFLTYINKYLSIPTDVPSLAKNFYFTLRYLEGTMNCLSILSMVKQFDPKLVEEMKTMIGSYLQEIQDQLKTV